MTNFWIEYSDGVNWKHIKQMRAKNRAIKLKRKWYNPLSWGKLYLFEPEARFMRRVLAECKTLQSQYKNLRAIDVWVHEQGEYICTPYYNGQTRIFELGERYWKHRDNPLGGLLLWLTCMTTFVCFVRWMWF